MCYHANNESLTDYISSAIRSYNITNSKCLKTSVLDLHVISTFVFVMNV